jgi:hypothetical protein
MTAPLPFDCAPPLPPAGAWGWRFRRCLSRCKEAWLQRNADASGTKGTPPAELPLPVRLLQVHVNAATYAALPRYGRWADHE